MDPVDKVEQPFFEILTESRKNEIKRMIGYAFLNILKQITFRNILNRQPWHRTDEDNFRLVNELKRHNVFKKFTKLKNEDFQQISRSLKYLELYENKILQNENETMT